jgi:hypothetical protein
MINISDKSYKENHNKLLYAIKFFRKPCALGDSVEKYGSARRSQMAV